MSQHVAWLCDSRFLSQRVLYLPKRGQAVLLKGYSNIFSYCPGDSIRSVQWGMIQDKLGRVLRGFVLDHSWTPFNQRPSDSRNCCRTREEPLKPHQKIIFSSTLFFMMETNCSKAFRNTAGPRNVHMSGMSAVLTEERSNNPFSRFCHKVTFDQHKQHRQPRK